MTDKSFDSLKAMIMLEVRGRHTAVHHRESLPQRALSTPGFFYKEKEVDTF